MCVCVCVCVCVVCVWCVCVLRLVYIEEKLSFTNTLINIVVVDVVVVNTCTGLRLAPEYQVFRNNTCTRLTFAPG